MYSFDVAKMVAFDLETTGKDPLTCRIVTSSLVRLTSGQAPDKAAMLADPGVEIPEEATRVHGITTERARAEGRPHAEVLNRTIGMLQSAWNDGYAVVAYNAAYDLTVLRAQEPSFTVDGLVVDPFVLDKHFDRYRKGKRTLEATCAHWNVRLDSAHDSTEDALAAARVAWMLARAHPELATMDGEELMELQAVAAWEQAESFREYLTGRGRDASDVDGSWPMRG
ncbi:exonuclease domain-containing protein [Corynebacterium sp. 335C]